MNVLTYVIISVAIILIWYLAFNSHPKNFGFLAIIGTFVLGGVFGYYMQSIEVAIFMSLGLSLIFVGDV